MVSFVILAASLFASLGFGSVCVEKNTQLPDGWKQLPDTLAADAPIQFNIALHQPEMHRLSDQISGLLSLENHLSLKDINLLRKPAQQHVDAVMRWLSSHGIQDKKVDHDWIQVQTSVGTAESLLQTKLHKYVFEDKSPVIRTTEYHVPDNLEKAISFIHPISNFMPPKHKVSSVTPMPQSRLQRRMLPCTGLITPDCIRSMYSINYKTPDDQSSIQFGIAGFLDEYANFQDYTQFLDTFSPDLAAKRYNFSVELVNGGTNPQDQSKSGTEAALDVDYGLAIGYPTQATYYSTGGRGVMLDVDGKEADGSSTNEPYLELFKYFLDMDEDKLPHVLSISYADDEVSVPEPYAERVCDMIGMLSGRGMSVLSGSGDGGARGSRSSNCKTNDGSGKKITMSTFPASCPWVTAVGATTNAAEVSGASFSTGGFSQTFQQPLWQTDDVKNYVAKLNGHLSEYYNPDMRAIPDISVVGTKFMVVSKGQMVSVDGTSASTPVFAAMIALVNDARYRLGKKSLGFLNVYLYSKEVKEILQDVTVGESVSCEWDGQKPGGWPAKTGWDAITGLGVPNNFEKLLAVLVEV